MSALAGNLESYSAVGVLEPGGEGSVHVVEPGDCIYSIAFSHGFFWRTIWDDPENGDLKRGRVNPGVLLPGDRVFVPELRKGLESCQTETRHTFRRLGVPGKFRIRVLLNASPEEKELEARRGTSGNESTDEPAAPEAPAPGERPLPPPYANRPFELEVDGASQRGSTDADGWAECAIAPDAKCALLTIHPSDDTTRVIDISLGHLDPPESEQGARQRLENLGFGGVEDDPEIAVALRLFQQSQGLKVTGRADDSTIRRLQSKHGS